MEMENKEVGNEKENGKITGCKTNSGEAKRWERQKFNFISPVFFKGEVEMFEDMIILDPAYPIPMLYEEPIEWYMVSIYSLSIVIIFV